MTTSEVEIAKEISLKVLIGNPYILSVIKQGLRSANASLHEHINRILESRKDFLKETGEKIQTLKECQIFLDQIIEVDESIKQISALLEKHWEKYIDVD